VSLLNDCKYGYSVLNNVMSLSLLRSSKRPDATADMGEHRFRYALFPHTFNDPMAAQVSRCGFQLNDPLRAVQVPGRLGSTPAQLFWLGQPQSSLSASASSSASSSSTPCCAFSAVRLDCVKPAEDHPEDAVVVRLYEYNGGQATASLLCARDMASVVHVNLLENPVPADHAADSPHPPASSSPFELVNSRVAALLLQPFQVCTLLIRFAKA
jgi:alpha-mannosidase